MKNLSFKRQMMGKKKKNQGMTLIEILMLLIVLGLALPGVLFYFYGWVGGLKDHRYRSMAVQMAQDLMEEVASKKWDENQTTTGPVSDSNKTSPANLGPDGGESRYQATASTCFDDIDDYNGFSENPPKNSQGTALPGFSNFSRTVQVYYVNASDLNTQVLSTPPPNYKRVRVVVFWDGGAKSVDLVSIFSNR